VAHRAWCEKAGYGGGDIERSFPFRQHSFADLAKLKIRVSVLDLIERDASQQSVGKSQ
jgi:hypothetical protein